MTPELRKRAEHALRAWQDLRKAAIEESGGTPSDDSSFSLLWDAGMSADDVVECALRQAAECASEQHAMRPGHVYCYACHSAACEHVYSLEGKHITTMTLQGDELDRRRRRGRYEPMPKPAADRFRKQVLSMLGDPE